MFMRAAALELNAGSAIVEIEQGIFSAPGFARTTDYWTLAQNIDLAQCQIGETSNEPPGRGRYIGESIRRFDLPNKIRGRGFVQDIRFPGICKSRRGVRRGPSIIRKKAMVSNPILSLFRKGDLPQTRFIAVDLPRRDCSMKARE